MFGEMWTQVDLGTYKFLTEGEASPGGTPTGIHKDDLQCKAGPATQGQVYNWGVGQTRNI
jgi:hypothetical protein